MLRIVLSVLFTAMFTVALIDLIPDGMWVQLGMLSAANFGFGALIAVAVYEGERNG